MQTNRFVNLNKAPVYIQDPKGNTFQVRPFSETLNDSTRRADGTYVLEGDFWSKYARGGKAGPLHPFPVPAAFGLKAFPPVQVHHHDGRADDGRTRTDGSSVDAIAVQPLPGKIRAAGDVITPAGKIRRRNPQTGLDEEVDDTPENRSVLQPLNPPGVQEPTAQLKRSIVDHLEELKIETPEQFDALPDSALLALPGMNPLALGRLRENIRALLVAQEDKKRKHYEDLIKDGMSDAEAREAAYGTPPPDEDEEEDEDDETEASDEDDEDEADEGVEEGDDEEEDEEPAKPAPRGKTAPVPLGSKPADTVSKKPAPGKPKPGVRKGGRDTTKAKTKKR